jgi:hypothetical protein
MKPPMNADERRSGLWKLCAGFPCMLLATHAQAAEQATVVFERVNAPALTVVYFADGRECTGRRPLPGKDGSVREGDPVLIDAGREVAFWLMQAQGVQAFGPLSVGEVCDVMVSFTPAAGARYRLTYRVSPDGRQCGAALARIETAGGGKRSVKEPTFRVRKALIPSLEDKPACAPLK